MTLTSRRSGQEGHAALRAAFRERFPWPDRLLDAGSAEEILVRCTIEAPRGEVWNLVSETSRLNRQLGIPAAVFHEQAGERRGRSEYFRTAFEWREPPWEWIREQALVCTKLFGAGRVEQLRAALLLEEPRAGLTELWAYYGWTARGWLGRALAGRINRFLERAYRALLPRVQGYLEGSSISESPLVRRPRALAAEARAELRQLEARLVEAGFEPPLVARLLRHIEESDPAELHRLRIRLLARQWGVEYAELLGLALHSTRLGLLTLSWDVCCPHCRGVRLEAPRLRQLPAEVVCEACDVVFSTREKERVELTFRVHTRIRAVEPRVYCAADAGTKPHVVFQLHLAPGEQLPVRLQLPAGDYLLRRRGLDEQAILRVQPQTAGAAAMPFPPAPAREMTVASELEVRLHNDLASRSTFVLEALRVEADCVLPGDVLGLGRYRDLFSGDSLAAGVRLDVGEQTIVVTDIVQSTRLYHVAGDDRAFVLVLEHFDAIYGIVEACGGAVIKTVGDSVLAAFASPAQGLEAALRIQQALPEASPLPLRISAHRGPCLAVNFNTGLDYFGSVVNEAVKLQRLAGPGDLVLSETLADDPALQPLLAGRKLHRLPFAVAPDLPGQMAAVVPAEP